MSTAVNPRCIFCEIEADRLACSVAYRDERWLAFMDVHPIREGHVLIVPRRHLGRMSALHEDERADLIRLANRVLAAQEALGFSDDGANLLLNDGMAANQHVPHLHLHCIPRKPGDQAGFGSRLLMRTFGLFGRQANRARLDEIAAMLAARIAS